MKVKDLKACLENLPDEMPIGILDLTTDDTDEANYPINKNTIYIDDCVRLDNPDEVIGKMLFFTFENSLNENSI